MADSAARHASGPAESSVARRLYYLGEGILVGAILHGGAYIATTVSAATLTDPVLVLFLIVITLTVLPVLTSRDDWERTQLAQEWYETRRWRWVAIVGILVAGVLVVGSVLVWAWTWPVDAVLLAMGIAIVGAMVRAAGMVLGSQTVEDGS